MKIKIFITLLLIILTIGAVSASNNITPNELGTDDIDAHIAQTLEDDNSLNMTNILEESTQITENSTSTKSCEKLNASYMISIDEDYVRGSGFEGEFSIEMYEREFLNGQLEVYIDDDLKFKASPAIDYGSTADPWESGEYKNSFCLLDIYFLDSLDLQYGSHKAEFKIMEISSPFLYL